MKRRWRKCSKCGEAHDRSQRYCRLCHNAYMRVWRRTHPMSPEQRRRDRCRSYANVYKRRGVLIQQPCLACGSTVHVEMHHEDYDKPLDVIWLCRPHHVRVTHGERTLLISRKAS